MKKKVKFKILKDKERLALYFFPLISVFALVSAFIAEFGFNLRPCVLCLYQRVPYYLVVVISVFAYLLITKKGIKQIRKKELINIFLVIYFLIFIAGGILAFYHTGVEKGVFTGPTTCSGAVQAESIDELREKVLGGPIVPCNIPAFILIGLSMAAWNGILSLFIATTAIYTLTLKLKNATRRVKRKRKTR